MFDNIIDKFNKDVTEALVFLNEKEFSPDYPAIEMQIKNAATIAEKELSCEVYAAMAELDSHDILMSEYRKAKENITSQLLEHRKYIKNKTNESITKTRDTFFDEISEGTEKENNIKKFLIEHEIIERMGYGEAEIWFEELKKI